MTDGLDFTPTADLLAQDRQNFDMPQLQLPQTPQIQTPQFTAPQVSAPAPVQVAGGSTVTMPPNMNPMSPAAFDIGNQGPQYQGFNPLAPTTPATQGTSPLDMFHPRPEPDLHPYDTGALAQELPASATDIGTSVVAPGDDNAMTAYQIPADYAPAHSDPTRVGEPVARIDTGKVVGVLRDDGVVTPRTLADVPVSGDTATDEAGVAKPASVPLRDNMKFQQIHGITPEQAGFLEERLDLRFGAAPKEPSWFDRATTIDSPADSWAGRRGNYMMQVMGRVDPPKDMSEGELYHLKRDRSSFQALGNQQKIDQIADPKTFAERLDIPVAPPAAEKIEPVTPPPVSPTAPSTEEGVDTVPGEPVAPAAAAPVVVESLDPVAQARLGFVEARVSGYRTALDRYNQMAGKTPTGTTDSILHDRNLIAASDAPALSTGRLVESNLALLETDPANRGALIAFRLAEPTEAEKAAGIDYASDAPDYNGFVGHVLERKTESAIHPAAREVINGYRQMQALYNADTTTMSATERAAHDSKLSALKAKFGDTPLNLTQIDDKLNKVAPAMDTYLRSSDAASRGTLDGALKELGSAASAAVLETTLAKYGLTALMGEADPASVPLTRIPATKTSFSDEATLARKLGYFGVARDLETIESRAQDLPSLVRLRDASMAAVAGAANRYSKDDIPPETAAGLSMLTETQQAYISAQERELASQVRRGTMSLPEYQAALSDHTRVATLQVQSGAAELMKSMISENPIFGRRGDGKLVWNWEGIIGSAGLALALYAPFERRESERRAERRADRRYDEDWERQKELLAIQQGYALERIGAVGEASKPAHGTPAGVSQARF